MLVIFPAHDIGVVSWKSCKIITCLLVCKVTPYLSWIRQRHLLQPGDVLVLVHSNSPQMQMNAAKKVCLFLLAAIKWCAQGDAYELITRLKGTFQNFGVYTSLSKIQMVLQLIVLFSWRLIKICSADWKLSKVNFLGIGGFMITWYIMPVAIQASSVTLLISTSSPDTKTRSSGVKFHV